jgi:hypothetical protein
VLAKTEALGGAWKLRTRGEKELRKGCYLLVSGPLRFRIPITTPKSKKWPSYGSKSTGTIVTMSMPKNFETVGWGHRGRPPKDPDSVMEYLREHLGVFYRGYLGVRFIGDKGPRHAKGKILTSLDWSGAEKVVPIEPDYDTRKHFSAVTVKTPAGKVKLEGEYGLLDPDSETTREDRKYYYHNTFESQGVDLRVGDRVMATRLLSEIWGKTRHNSYNAFWGEFRIPGVRERIPRTLNNKTSIDFDDEVWGSIASAIRSQLKDPLQTKRSEKSADELTQELYEKLDATKLPGDVVEMNYGCWGGARVVIDIYRKVGGKIIIYEAKPGKARPLDVYQLRLYWDGLVEDGKHPTQGYLVAQEKTTGVSTIVKALNGFVDGNGKKYKVEFKTWEDLGIK